VAAASIFVRKLFYHRIIGLIKRSVMIT